MPAPLAPAACWLWVFAAATPAAVGYGLLSLAAGNGGVGLQDGAARRFKPAAAP